MFSLFGFLKGILIQHEADRSKELALTVSTSATTGTRTTLEAAQTVPRVLTLPDATDTLVGKATTDVLTNKTLDGDTNVIQDLALSSLKTNLTDAGKFIVRDVAGVAVSDSKAVPAGVVLGTTDAQTLTNKTINADLNTISNIEDADIKASAGIDASKLGDGSVSNTEFGYLRNVSSDLQGQIDDKATDLELATHLSDTTTHGTVGNIVGESDTQTLTNKTINADLNTITNIENADIKAAAAIDATKIANGSVTNTEFQYLDGVTSGIQAQLESKAGITSTYVDNHVVRADGTSSTQNSGVVISDLDAVTGVTALTVDSIQLDANEIKSLTTDALKLTTNDASQIVYVDRRLEVLGIPGGGQRAQISLYEDTDNGANKTIIQPQASLTANNTLTLPSSTDTLVGKATTDTLTNKTLTSPVITTPTITGGDLDGGTASNTNRLTLPKAAKATLDALTRKEATILYASDEDKVYYDDGSSLRAVGSGAGGNKNYLGTVNNVNGNGDFELGSTTGWTLGVTGALSNGLPTTTPTFGSGAAGTLSISAVSSGQLAGTYSLSYLSSAATTVGNMVASSAFTIDIEDQAKIMTVKFAYKAQTNPANANFSGTSLNSYSWAIYDVTAASWIIPTGAFGMTQSSGVGICTGTFQTSATSTSYRLVVYNSAATTGACTIYFDDFYVGPQTAPLGAITTDWVKIPLVTGDFGTGFGTVTAIDVWSRRVGDSLQMQGKWVNGTTAASTAYIKMGFNGAVGNVSMDTTKIPETRIVGVGSRTGSGSAAPTVIATPGQGSILNFGLDSHATVPTNVAQFGSTAFSNGEGVYINAIIPIQGWSSTVQVSSDTDTRVVALVLTGSSTSITNAGVGIVPTTVLNDTHGGFSGSTYTVPVSGFYRLSASMNGPGVAYSASHIMSVSYKKNGVASQYLGMHRINATATNSYNASGSHEIFCNAGDTLQFIGQSEVTGTIIGFQASIVRVSGPSVIAASETVAFHGGTTAQTNFSSTTITLGFTAVVDTHNSFLTNAYTIPVSGVYNIHTIVPTYHQTASNNAFCIIAVNGATATQTYVTGDGAGQALTPSANYMARLKAGDTVSVKMQNTSGGTTTLMGGLVGATATLSITKVGI